jgi:hypothetical protein
MPAQTSGSRGSKGIELKANRHTSEIEIRVAFYKGAFRREKFTGSPLLFVKSPPPLAILRSPTSSRAISLSIIIMRCPKGLGVRFGGGVRTRALAHSRTRALVFSCRSVAQRSHKLQTEGEKDLAALLTFPFALHLPLRVKGLTMAVA